MNGGTAPSGVGSGLTNLTQDSGYPESDLRAGISTPNTLTSLKDASEAFHRTTDVANWDNAATANPSATPAQPPLPDPATQMSTTSSLVSSGLGTMASSRTGSSTCGDGDGSNRQSRTATTVQPLMETSNKMAFWESRNDRDTAYTGTTASSTTNASCLFPQMGATQTVVSDQSRAGTAASTTGSFNPAAYPNWGGNQTETGYANQPPSSSIEGGYNPSLWPAGQPSSYFPSAYPTAPASEQPQPQDVQEATPRTFGSSADWSRAYTTAYPDYNASFGGQTQSANYPLYPLDHQASAYRGYGGWGGGNMTGSSNTATPTSFQTPYAGLLNDAMNSRLMDQSQSQSQQGSNLEVLQPAVSASSGFDFNAGNTSGSYDSLSGNLVVCSMPPLLQAENAGLYPTAFN